MHRPQFENHYSRIPSRDFPSTYKNNRLLSLKPSTPSDEFLAHYAVYLGDVDSSCHEGGEN